MLNELRKPLVVWTEIRAEFIVLQICVNEKKKDFISIQEISLKLAGLFNEFAEIARDQHLREMVDGK